MTEGLLGALPNFVWQQTSLKRKTEISWENSTLDRVAGTHIKLVRRNGREVEFSSKDNSSDTLPTARDIPFPLVARTRVHPDEPLAHVRAIRIIIDLCASSTDSDEDHKPAADDDLCASPTDSDSN